jgi:hypothetical protein
MNMALGTIAPDVCVMFDQNGDREVTIDELIGAVNVALTSCDFPSPRKSCLEYLVLDDCYRWEASLIVDEKIVPRNFY